MQFRVFRVELDCLLIVLLRSRAVAFPVVQQGQAVLNIRPGGTALATSR